MLWRVSRSLMPREIPRRQDVRRVISAGVRSCRSQAAVQKCGFQQLNHPPYCSDVAPSDYLLWVLKKSLRGPQFSSDENVKAASNGRCFPPKRVKVIMRKVYGVIECLSYQLMQYMCLFWFDPHLFLTLLGGDVYFYGILWWRHSGGGLQIGTAGACDSTVLQTDHHSHQRASWTRHCASWHQRSAIPEYLDLKISVLMNMPDTEPLPNLSF